MANAAPLRVGVVTQTVRLQDNRKLKVSCSSCYCLPSRLSFSLSPSASDLSKMQTEGGLLFPIASSSLASLPFLICDPALDAPSWTHHVGHSNTVRTTLYDRHPNNNSPKGLLVVLWAESPKFTLTALTKTKHQKEERISRSNISSNPISHQTQ